MAGRPLEEILEEILSETRENREEIKQANEYNRDSFRLSTRLVDELSNLAGIQTNIQAPFAFISTLFENVQKQREVFNTFQQQALAFGKSVSVLKADLGTRQNLKDFGPQIALTTAVAALETGTLGLSEETYNLANEMTAAGENGRNLLLLQRSLLSQGGLSISQMDNLAVKLKESRDAYSISTDQLVQSINLLSDKFGEFSLMGVTDEITNALVDLTNIYGPQNAQMLSDVIKAISTGSRLTEFSRMGLAGKVAAVQAAPTAAGYVDIAQQATAAAKQFYESQKAGLMPSMAAQRTQQMFGPEIFKMIQLANAPEYKGPSMDAKEVSKMLQSQEAVQRDIAENSNKTLGKLGELLSENTKILWTLGFSAGIAINAMVTAQRMVTAIRSVENAIRMKPELGSAFDKLMDKNMRAAATMPRWVTPMIGSMTAIGGLIMSASEIAQISSGEQSSLLALIFASMTTLTSLMAVFPQLSGVMVGVLGPLGQLMAGIATFLFANPIGLAILAVAAAVAGLIYWLSDDNDDASKPQPVKIVAQREGGTVTTNSFLSANSDLTKAILSNALSAKKSDDMMLSEVKKQSEMMEKQLDLQHKLLKAGYTPRAAGGSLGSLGN